MKAACITETGDPDVIQYRDVPEPEAAAGQVVVAVQVVAVNPIDTYIRSGAVAMELPSPFVIGCDLAGTVQSIGDGVTRFKPGDRVWGSNQGLLGRQGTFAEVVAVDEHWLYPIPDGVSEQTTVAGALVGITAGLGLFTHANLQAGETVFVNGGTGGVGASVVQLAKAAGARVIATVGSAEKQTQCMSLGADVVLNYKSATLDDDITQAAESLGGIDIWWETRREPTLERSLALLNKRGRLIIMAGRTARPELPIGPFYTRDLKLIGFAMFNASPDEQREIAERINTLAANGNWNPPVGRVFPLSEAAAAHRLQEQNTLENAGTLSGKILLTVGS